MTRPERRSSSPLVGRLAPLRGRPTQRAVLAELRRVILAGDAPPGSVIPLDDVAAALGMSVIPVRESLKILIGEGLVEQHMRGAYTVARLSRSELLELYTARGVLENTVLAVAVVAAGHADHTHARAAHDLLDQAVRAGDLRAYHRETREFHFPLLTPARMRRFVGMVESAWNLTESYRPMAYLSDADRQRLHADHGEMLAAFVARDAAGLLSRAEAHHRRLALARRSDGRTGKVEAPSGTLARETADQATASGRAAVRRNNPRISRSSPAPARPPRKIP